EFTADEARDAGRKGGLAVSQNREHMSMIGREGGKSRGRNVARRLAEQRSAQQEAPRAEGQGDEVNAGQRVESEGRNEGAFMGGPSQSERSGGEDLGLREDIVEGGDERGRGGRGGLGGPDQGE